MEPCIGVPARGLEERQAGGQRGQEPHPGTGDEEVLAELAGGCLCVALKTDGQQGLAEGQGLHEGLAGPSLSVRWGNSGRRQLVSHGSDAAQIKTEQHCRRWRRWDHRVIPARRDLRRSLVPPWSQQGQLRGQTWLRALSRLALATPKDGDGRRTTIEISKASRQQIT